MAANTIAQAPAVITGTTVTTISKTFAGACTSGSLIIASCTGEGFSVTHTVTDGANAGNYTQDVQDNTTSDVNSGHGRASVNSIANTSTTAVQVTLTYSGTTHGSLQIAELTNSGGSPTFDSSGSAHQPNNITAAMSMSITTATNNCSIFCCATHFDNAGVTNDTSYTSRQAAFANQASYHSIEDRADAGTAGGNTLTFGSTGNKAFAIVAAGYKPPAGAGGTAQGIMFAPSLDGVGSYGILRGNRPS